MLFSRHGLWLACLLIAASANHASAELDDTPPKFNLRVTIGPGIMTSHDQLGDLRYDRVGLLGDMQVARTFAPWLELRGKAHFARFYASHNEDNGGLIAFAVGPTFQKHSSTVRPYAGFDFGAGITGLTVRPFLSVSAGIDLRANERISAGPVVTYGRLFERNDPGLSTDASYVWVGLSLRARFDTRKEKPVKLKPKVVTVYDRIVRQAPRLRRPSPQKT